MCWILDSDGLDFESNGVWVGFRFFFFDKQVGFRLVCLGWCGGAVMGVVMIGFFGYFPWVCWVCG